MKRTAPLLLILLALVAMQCKKIEPVAPARIQLDSTLVAPVTELTVPVYFPVKELENMANEKLNHKIIEAKLNIGQKSDTLFLSISRFRPIRMTYDGHRGITYALPVQIEGFFHSKVLGINIQNKEPVRAQVIITLFSDLYLDDYWNLAPQTQLKKIEWIEEPKLNLAGIKINLKPQIEKVLDGNKQKIVDKLDESAKDMIKIRPAIEKLWGDIQKPIRINKKVVPVWLKSDATDMDGILLARSTDTLMILASIKANLRTVLDSASSLKKVGPLPKLKRQTKGDAGLTAYALATIPFEVVNQVIRQVTDTMKLEFGGHTVRIKSSEIYGTKEGIAIRISVTGDLKADLFLRGTIAFDTVDQKLVIDHFGYDVNTESSLVAAANWFAHDQLVDRLKPYLSLPMENTFSVIPELITKGVEKGKLGKKIDIHFEEFDVNIYQHLITTKNIQVILSAKGKADVELQKGLFNKKKKPA